MQVLEKLFCNLWKLWEGFSPFVLPSLNCETQYKKIDWHMQVLEKTSVIFENCGKVFHP